MHAALKNYLALAGGVAEMAKDKALELSQTVVMQGLTTVTKATGLAEDVRQQGQQNAEAVAALVKFEAARALGRVGLAPAQEVADLQDRVRSLEVVVRQHETVQAGLSRAAAAVETSAASTPTAAAVSTPAAAAPVKSAPVKSAPVKSAPVKAVPAKRPAARKRAAAVVVPAPASSAPASSAPASSAPSEL